MTFNKEPRSFGIVAIGASAGGVSVVRKIIGALETSFATPVAVVQHMTSSARVSVDLVYGVGPSRRITEVEDKMAIEPSTVYLSAPSYHMLIEKEGHFALSQDELVRFARPSIDVFFSSVAAAYGPLALGVLLTGASSDGAEGLLAIKRAGGMTIVQDPKDAEYDTMPLAAMELLKPDLILPAAELADYLNRTRTIVSERTI